MIDTNLIIIISWYTQSTLLSFFVENAGQNQIYVLHGGNNTHPQQREKQIVLAYAQQGAHELKFIWQQRVAILLYCSIDSTSIIHKVLSCSLWLEWCPPSRTVRTSVFLYSFSSAGTDVICWRGVGSSIFEKVSLDPFSSKSYEQRSNSQNNDIRSFFAKWALSSSLTSTGWDQTEIHRVCCVCYY